MGILFTITGVLVFIGLIIYGVVQLGKNVSITKEK